MPHDRHRARRKATIRAKREALASYGSIDPFLRVILRGKLCLEGGDSMKMLGSLAEPERRAVPRLAFYAAMRLEANLPDD